MMNKKLVTIVSLVLVVTLGVAVMVSLVQPNDCEQRQHRPTGSSIGIRHRG